MKASFIFIAIIMFTGDITAFCQKKDTLLDIYILMGQSNMAGRGKMTPSLKELRDPDVVALDSHFNWVEARHPIHFDKPGIAGVGPGLSFGIAMAKASRGKKVGLVPCAVGGTSIDKWKPGAYDDATKTHPYDDAAERIRYAMTQGTIKGVIWHQGEANSSPDKINNYLVKLEELILRVRTLVGNPGLPFIAGELGDFRDQYQHINKLLALLPAQVKFTSIAKSDGLTDKGDKTHFDGLSADELGKRFAKEMIKVSAPPVLK
ncbi:sialate O-acetylesterase [Niabella sp. W65]|nr:sialate O-acetylesterase [Niabella sp. W65]MCH7362852.1 sialate O-acetylesterase [Niabella sp. W65]